MQTNLTQAIEAILFATAEPYTFASLAKELQTDVETIAHAVQELKTMLSGHGIEVHELNQTVHLVTRSEYKTYIEAIRKAELSKELSKASAETLAVVAYLPGISKSQIEFIRGVNVTYSLRSLTMRGLVEAKGVGRSITYHPTLALLADYGIASIEELPAYVETKASLEKLLVRQTSAEPAQ